MRSAVIKVIVSALLVGVISIGAGFGIDVGDSSLTLAKEALNAGIEGLIATLVAAVLGMAAVRVGSPAPPPATPTYSPPAHPTEEEPPL
ncbi:MAG: hypothetical protein J2P57_08795 [Acidimicrobiaceae bacterium]|nr:hypothetical protein [Acidimicrobiaceae bacterium]